MVSVSSTAFSASMAARSVALLKIKPVQPPISRRMTPTVQVVATKDSLAIIASLIDKLMAVHRRQKAFPQGPLLNLMIPGRTHQLAN